MYIFLSWLYYHVTPLACRKELMRTGQLHWNITLKLLQGWYVWCPTGLLLTFNFYWVLIFQFNSSGHAVCWHGSQWSPFEGSDKEKYLCMPLSSILYSVILSLASALDTIILGFGFVVLLTLFTIFKGLKDADIVTSSFFFPGYEMACILFCLNKIWDFLQAPNNSKVEIWNYFELYHCFVVSHNIFHALEF